MSMDSWSNRCKRIGQINYVVLTPRHTHNLVKIPKIIRGNYINKRGEIEIILVKVLGFYEWQL